MGAKLRHWLNNMQNYFSKIKKPNGPKTKNLGTNGT